MKRHLYPKLLAWKNSEPRKPLLLMGARQVGKTTLLKKFAASEYPHNVYINFDLRPDLKALFKANLDPERIIRDLNLALDTDIMPGKSLLFLDEIQECPEALNSLKYFNEKAKKYHVCGAGSLLGVKLANTQGFPVGQVHFETLYPLNFIEYLTACGEHRLSDYLSTISLQDQISEPLHAQCMQSLKKYLYVGGMPEAVNVFKSTDDFLAARLVHENIIRAYELDFTKHAPPSLILKITESFNSITNQLGKENKKFIYSVIREGARARNYEAAVQWLLEAGLMYKLFNNHTPKIPLKAYENSNLFKLYLVDVGLLNTLANLPVQYILNETTLFQEFRGSLTENFVTQELAPQLKTMHYWTSEGRAEVDFVFQHASGIVPLEVKSGYSNQKKSMIYYCDKYKPKLSIRTSPQNLKIQKSFINLPLYLIGQLDRLLK